MKERVSALLKILQNNPKQQSLKTGSQQKMLKNWQNAGSNDAI